ncbi:MAG: metallophosphoesterase [Muribaculaceae bacterium]|nr:metallophosphoesterase [Muribaculaceae bacterium]
MKKLLLSIAIIAASMCATVASHAQSAEQPLLTIGCLSDLHNEFGLINCDVDNVRLRGTITNTLNAMKEQEHIDMLILGGDYTSDCTIPETNWARVKDLLHDATVATFSVGSDYFPVLYCTGNHDYEVANFDAIPKPYNAARYYDFVMKSDLGELGPDDCFYEDADNGNLGTMRVLAAYHYRINGFDFVVLNCGRHYFKSAWDYNYSDASVEWVADKLDELYARDPDKTVFFVAHLPFPDSNSISNSNKGQSNSDLLKKTLARHPNVVFLYGHDHGSDNAFIRAKTSQRVTRYNTYGYIISAYDDTHIDGLTPGEDEVETPDITTGSFYIINKADGKYLGYDGNNAGTISAKNLSVITEYNSTDATFRFEIGLNGMGQKYLHIGSNGRFSIGDASPIYVYKVTANDGEKITAEKVSTFGPDGDYLIVGRWSDGNSYALTNTLYNPGSANQRLDSDKCALSGTTLTVGASDNVLWHFTANEPAQPTEPGIDITSGSYCIRSVADKGYLNFGTFNVQTETDPVACNITEQEVGVFNISLGQTDRYLFCGTNGRFSGNTTAFPIILYEVDDKAADSITCHKVNAFQLGKQYIVTGLRSGKTYALTNELISAGTSGQRLLSTLVSLDGNQAKVPADDGLLWEFTVLPEAAPSFFSAFMGSMREYNNSIAGAVSVSNSRVVQALMIYVYSDRIVLQMKNYGETGTLNGIDIADQPKAYTVFRPVKKDDSAPSGISSPDTDREQGPEAIYDLHGRRVRKTNNGIYIVNGEKMAY